MTVESWVVKRILKQEARRGRRVPHELRASSTERRAASRFSSMRGRMATLMQSSSIF
jgi:hypothetical protein